jgi:hypothetical protein
MLDNIFANLPERQDREELRDLSLGTMDCRASLAMTGTR